jgi:AcrR family transcriptional regulator
LLRQAVDDVLANGLAGLALRPLATALGVSPPALLYHFDSKDALMVAILEEAHRRALERFEARGLAAHSDLWSWLAADATHSYLRLFFEVYALGLAGHRQFAALLRRGIDDWLALGRRLWQPTGLTAAEADARATLIVAASRGLLLDLLATGDQERIERAARLVATFLSPDRDEG